MLRRLVRRGRRVAGCPARNTRRPPGELGRASLSVPAAPRCSSATRTVSASTCPALAGASFAASSASLAPITARSRSFAVRSPATCARRSFGAPSGGRSGTRHHDRQSSATVQPARHAARHWIAPRRWPDADSTGVGGAAGAAGATMVACASVGGSGQPSLLTRRKSRGSTWSPGTRASGTSWEGGNRLPQTASAGGASSLRVQPGGGSQRRRAWSPDSPYRSQS